MSRWYSSTRSQVEWQNEMGRPRKYNRDLPERVYIQHGTYYYVPWRGSKIRLGRDFVSAMTRWAEVTGKSRAPALDASLGTIIDAYIREVLPTKAPRTQQDYLVAVRLLRQAFGHMQPADIAPHHIYAYMDARAAPVRANREKALLSGIFHLAIRKGIKTENPCRLVKRNRERPRDRLVEDHEIATWRKHAGPLLNAYVDLKLLTGQRQGDLLRLTRSADKANGLHIDISKTNRKVIFHWSPELRGTIDGIYALPRRVSCLALFPASRGKRRGAALTQAGFKSLWQRAMNAYVAAGGTRFTEHDLRGKVATDARAQGRDAQTLLQHRTSAQTDAYIKVRQVEVIKPLTWTKER
jgi:integrase